MKTPSTRSAEATARALSRKLKTAGFPKADYARFGIFRCGFEVRPVFGANLVSIEYIPERGIPDEERKVKRQEGRQRLQEWLTAAGYPVSIAPQGGLYIQCEAK